MALVETALAFTIAMLAASLFVSVAVQGIQRLGRYRVTGLELMLERLIDGFRTYHNDPRVDQPAAKRVLHDADDLFVQDVLGDPLVFARGEALDRSGDASNQDKLCDSISADDLVGIVYNYARFYQAQDDSKIAAAGPAAPVAIAPGEPVNAVDEPTTIRAVLGSRAPAPEPSVQPAPVVAGAASPEDVPLPLGWVGGDARMPYATCKNFAAYASRWFARVELTATERFRTQAARLTAVVAATVVVAFCLDGLALLSNLYGNGSGRSSLIAQTASLEASAARLGAAGPRSAAEGAPPAAPEQLATKDYLLELTKTATLLDQAHVGIGWQSSKIVQRWCAYRGLCEDAHPPTFWDVVRETAQSIVGLFFSLVMLMLGAPFWFRVLTSLTRYTTGVTAKGGAGAPGG